MGNESSTYSAWALFTGPESPIALWEDSRWITGAWNGLTVDTQPTPLQIQNDIDARIDCIMNSFQLARQNISNPTASFINYFVIPEFYFHCNYGPYPGLQINDKSVYEYICSTLQDRIENISLGLKDGEEEKWIICAGSILTTTLTDIEEFLQSPEVISRLNELNEEVGKLPLDELYKAGESRSYIKAKGYFKAERTVKAKYAAVKDTTPEVAINALMTKYRADPLCVVRNRGVLYKAVFGGQSGTVVQSWRYEKQNESTVDLTMGNLTIEDGKKKLEIGGMITEWMAGYPSISIINGDKNTAENPMAARMTIDEFPQAAEKQEIGVEVCLDHRLKRLRRTVDMTQSNGAAEDNPPLNAQIIASGGMQILDESVTAGVAGVIFNSDGCDPILDQYNDKGKPVIDGSGIFKEITCGVYASSAQAMLELNNHKYYSHSQLSFRYGTEGLDGYDNALGTKNQKGATYDSNKKNEILDAFQDPKRIGVPDNESGKLFAARLGELHIFQPNNT